MQNIHFTSISYNMDFCVVCVCVCGVCVGGWQSLSGVVVECSPLVQDDGRLTVESSLNGGGSEDCSTDDMARNIEEVMAENSAELALNHTEGGTWFIINSAVLIQEVIVSVGPLAVKMKLL